MQRLRRTVAITAVLLLTSGVSVFAQGRGGGGQKPKTQSSVPKASTGAPKAPLGPKYSTPAATKPPKAAAKTTTTPKTTTTVKSAKATKPASSTSGGEKSKATSHASAKKSSTTSTTASASTSTATGTSTTAGGTTVASSPTLTAVQQKLQKNTNLASKVQSRLPQGTDLMKAAEGFRNLGQFVAAVNVSNNLGLDFAKLKMKMVDDGLSLGQSIQALKPASSGAD